MTSVFNVPPKSGHFIFFFPKYCIFQPVLIPLSFLYVLLFFTTDSCPSFEGSFF